MDRVTELIASLQDTDAYIQRNAMQNLTRIGLPAVSPLMTAILADADEVRCQLIEMLRELHDPRSVPILVESLEDTDEHVRSRAAEALRELGSASVPALMEALKYPNLDMVKTVVDLLGKIRDARAVPALMEALSHQDKDVRKNVAFALGAIGDFRAAPALMDALKDPETEVRWASVHALGAIQDARAIPALIAVFTDQDASVRSSVALALEKYGVTAIPPLVKTLRDNGSRFHVYLRGDWDLLRTLAKALGKIAGRDPAPELRSALPTLHRLSNRDPDREEMSDFKDAIDKIETVTAEMKDLPLPAAMPRPDTASLPRPATAPTTSPDGLPIPSAPAAENDADLESKRHNVGIRSRRGLVSRWWKRDERH